MSCYRVLVDVILTNLEVFCITDAVVCEASLPDRELCLEGMGEASFKKLHSAF